MNTQDIISNEQVSSLERIAAIVAKSGMGGFKTPEQATVAMLLALAEGIPLGRIIHEYHVINGRLSLHSESMLARFQRAGGTIKYIEHTETCVSVTASHPKGGALTVTWTLERARKAGLTSNPTWQKHPAAMLTARAIAEAVRAVYPACLSGIITEDEAFEITAAFTPAPTCEPMTEFVTRHGNATGGNATGGHATGGSGTGANGTHQLPDELEPAAHPERTPREYVLVNGDRYATPLVATPLVATPLVATPLVATPSRRPRKSSNGSKSPGPLLATESSQSDPAASLPDPADPHEAPESPVCGAHFSVVPAQTPPAAPQNAQNQPEQEAHAEPEAKRPSSLAESLWHPLEDALASLNQTKLSAFLLKQGFVAPEQTYKWVGPNATSRILKQLPSFLKAAGFEEELVS
jgi:RecT family